MWESPLIQKIVELAILEDLQYGDLTSNLCVDPNLVGQGKIFSKDDFIVCGLPIIPIIIKQSGYDLSYDIKIIEGARVNRGELLAEINGKLKDMISLERTFLNFIQRLSGCATYTNEVVKKAGGILVADTRKTTPGWRILEKYAVTVGGGKNHRFSLSDMILVKDNHIDANNGSVKQTLEKIVTKKGVYTPFEVEVRSLTELKDSLSFQPTSIMLDNMSDEEIANCITLIKERSPASVIEVSGGISSEMLSKLSKIGVALVSMGALTSKYQTVDISMDIILLN